MKKLTSVLLVAAGLLAGITVHATPFASCISNINNNVSFILNEGGGNVTVTYEDGSINANFNGVTTGLNLPPGPKSFSFAGHTSYSISVYKIGTGSPSVITNIARGTGRGIACNVNSASPFFGFAYSVIGGAGVITMRSDGFGNGNGFPWTGTLKEPPGPSVTWGTDTASQYFISVAPDDYVLVSDYASPSEGGVIRVDPTFSSASLLFANITGLSQNDTVDFNHGDAESRAIMTLPVGTAGNQVYVVEGTYVSPYNQIIRYDIGNADYNNNGLLPWGNDSLRPPDFIGAQVNPSVAGYGSGLLRSGLSIGTNGYFYVSIDRANLSNPNLQVYAPDGATLLWSSFYTNSANQLKDYTVTGTTQLPETGWGVPESALSPDNRYLALVHGDNHITIFTLTNGIPDLSTEYMINNKADLVINTNTHQTLTTNIPSGGLSARGICWDAANNLWASFNSTVAGSTSSSGVVLHISTGRTATAITTGNASGSTGFHIVSPTEVDISSVQAMAPQANSYAGYPLASTNTVTRTGDISSPLSVPFTLTGTAPNGTYTVNVTNTINFAPGQSSTNIVISAVTDGVPRPTTTVIMTLTVNQSGQYIVGFQNQATTFIVNTATPQLTATAAASSMYKAYSNDYTSIAVTRIGDTNVAITSSAFTYGGTAVRNTDFTTTGASTTVAFNKGDLTKTVHVAKPLINGQIPVHTSNPTYTGDKTFTVTVPAGTGYTVSTTNTATLTIVDNAYPTATVLYSNPLTDPNDAVNWNVTALVGDVSASPDYNLDFGYDLTSNNGQSGVNGLITPPPSGATAAMHITTAKQFGNQAAVVNAYLTNMTFSGNYAVRFSMYIVQGQNIANSAEGPIFGINHNGLETNWWYGSGTLTGSPWTADGVWYWVDAWAGGAASDYRQFIASSNNIPNSGWRVLPSSTFASWQNAFKDPEDFTSVNTSSNAVAGVPANASPFVKPNLVGNWADVQIMTSNNIVTLSINKQQIFSLANTNSLFQQGCIMLGYETPFASIPGAGPEASVYFSDLKVVSIASGTTQSPTITSTSVVGGNAVIKFTSPNGADTTTSFTLQSVAVVNGTFADASSTITGGSGVFQATVPLSGATQFYRIRHN